MLTTAQSLVRRIARRLNITEEEVTYLLTPNAIHEFDITLSRGTTHKAYRVQHNNELGPYKGGIRFHHEVDLGEVQALALLMALKTAAVGLPLGGGKGGVAVNAKELTPSEQEELARAYARGLSAHIGPDVDIPAPDVNTNAQIIDWMVDEFEQRTGDRTKASFTGKSLGNGGSEGRQAATGRGGVIVLRELLKLMGKDSPMRIGVQGFGNVGSFFGEIAELQQPDWRLVAATDSSGGIELATGLSATKLDQAKSAGQRLIDFRQEDARQITNQEIVTSQVDILVLAALGGVVTKDNMRGVRASIILELANGPVDEVAYDYLSSRGVVVVPDILANAGGVIVSYLEWLQNRQNEHWDETRVNKELEKYLVSATRAAYEQSVKDNVSLKEAAIAIALGRILDKKKETINGRSDK